MRSEKLTEEMVQQAGPIEGTTLYRLPDGDEDKYGNGLFLFRWWTGKKTWKIRYAINGKKYWFVLGTYPQLSLEEARNMAADAFRNVKAGIHPESICKREEEERKNRLILDMGILPLLENTALFYPCSGGDLSTPIQLFSPFVTDFWFVDRGYFTPGHQDTSQYGLDAPANKQKPVLKKDHDYRLMRTKIAGPVSWSRSAKDIEPCVLTETYKYIPSGKQIRIHRCRGYGFSAFRKEISSIGVFFYRGDSEGEGGSGNLWLSSDHIGEVCEKLVDGGLIVTDGSGSGYSYRYGELAKFYFKDYPRETDNIMESVNSFTDEAGRTFTCIGYAGYKYGPTFIWQVKKATQHCA